MGLSKFVTVISNKQVQILIYFHGHIFPEKKNNGRVKRERNYFLFACKDKQMNKRQKGILFIIY